MYNYKIMTRRNTIEFDFNRLSEKERQQLQDLISEFDDGAKGGSVENFINKPGTFPVEEEVEVRSRLASKSERPKTYTAPPVTKNDEILDFPVPCRIEIAKEQCIQVKIGEKLRLVNGQIQIFDELGSCKLKLKTAINTRKGVKLISRQEVEMIDLDKKNYRFQFDTIKDAKMFMECLPKEKSGPFSWTQLLKLLKKRSSRDLLESKGIIKNEPIFGNTLQELCKPEQPVPEVVVKIVHLIELPENIKSVGLYRASANLAIVQNIRCEINCGKWEILEKYEREVDVLTGTLKLFFRELKEPLIPYHTCQELLAIMKNPSSQTTSISAIIDSLPEANKATLLFIIRHLLKVCEHRNENKMDFHNISICWGPSLITFPDNCTDLVTQTTEFTKITECLLEYYQNTMTALAPPTLDCVYETIRKIAGVVDVNLGVEGIYRKSGSATKVEKICKFLENNQLVEIEKTKCEIHDICCAFKKYLSLLKDPLIPNCLFERFFQDCDILDDNSLRQNVKKMVESAPRREALMLLLQHLRNVVKHEKKNKMSVKAMADIWIATLAKPVIHQYKKKSSNFEKLFEILITLTEPLPDLLAESEIIRMRESTYDNLLDSEDITLDEEWNKQTKL